jgi:purine-nucleoside phosphorylase
MSAFAEFQRIARPLAPRAAVVLGSGLGGVANNFRESASIAFSDVPKLAPPSVHGHGGRVAVGTWNNASALLVLGRLHFYEGHSPEVVTGTVCVAAELGVRRLILTNAAGGIHPSLGPGSLMAIRGHVRLVGADAWRSLSSDSAIHTAYSPKLLALMPQLHSGVYAALTGPCYETPAEIRALAAFGAHAVGMSTALEAEAAAKLGLEVAAISCITNRAAGLGADTLDHAEVLANATLAVERLRDAVGRLVLES